MGYSVDSNGRVVEERESRKEHRLSGSESGLLSIAKVFGYMAIGLLITAVVAFGLGASFYYWIGSGDSVKGSALTTYLLIMIVSGATCLIIGIMLNFMLYRGNHNLVAPAIIYSVAMGALLSSFTMFIDWRLLGGAFLITAVIFGIMTLIASLAKNLNALLIVGLGLFMGAGMMYLFNFLMGIWLGPEVWTRVMWIISFIYLVAIMLVTTYDIWRIKVISQRGEMTKNLEIYCAFTLYVDFIYIFVRLVLLLLRFSGSRR